MAKWWMGVAVVLGVGGSAAWAQGPMVYPTEAAPFSPAGNYAPMPAPAGAMPPGAMPPGAMPAGAMPGCPVPAAGPGMPSLPGDTPNAWCDAPPRQPEPCAWYVDVGGLALQRQRMGNTILAVLDPTAVADTGALPPANAPTLAHFGSVPQDWQGGVKAGIGYKSDCCALEATGFYLPAQTSASTFAAPNQIDEFFINAPPGFGGTAGLFLQADVLRVSLRNELANAEVNARWWSHNYYTSFELLAGVRYVNLDETLDIYTGDNDLTVLPPNPTTEATYEVRAHNHIVAPQLGLNWCGYCCKWLSMGFSAKAALGMDFGTADVSLVRGDGLVGFQGHRSSEIFSQVYDTNLNVTVHPWDGVYVRGGYMAFWAVDVIEAQRQVDFNLADTTGSNNNSGSVFYHGPFLELELFF